jgi:undecaprenyl-diphosphatase
VTEKLEAIDRSIFLFLNGLHLSWLDPVMVFFSGQGIWVPFIGHFFWHSYKLNGKRATWFFGLFLLLTLMATDVTSSYLLKNIVNRLRPCRDPELLSLIYSFGQKCGGKYGFVSSHAANSVALVLFSLRSLTFQKKWIYFLWIIPLIVAYSRVYLGVHYPGDVVGGALVGTLWAMIFSVFYKSAYGANRNLLH